MLGVSYVKGPQVSIGRDSGRAKWKQEVGFL